MATTPPKIRILFVCTANRLRSPTAEQVFSTSDLLLVKSAGISTEATVPVTRELLEWADLIFVMEKQQRNAIRKRFPDVYLSRPITCLYIPDEFDFMDPGLIDLLKSAVPPHIERLRGLRLTLDSTEELNRPSTLPGENS